MIQFQVIMALVKPHITDLVVDAVKKAGATGATVIPARGTGIHEAKTFFGLAIEDKTEILMFLVKEDLVATYLEVIKKAGKFDQPGTGIAFALPVSQVVGLESQMSQSDK